MFPLIAICYLACCTGEFIKQLVTDCYLKTLTFPSTYKRYGCIHVTLYSSDIERVRPTSVSDPCVQTKSG